MKRSLILAALLLVSAAPALFARIWTDRQGRQVEAQFIRLRGDIWALALSSNDNSSGRETLRACESTFSAGVNAGPVL
jgi:hypothetical protein